MTMYLLLRNNKQSGPYSLEDLKTMGLRAYDLVWVEGRSAAWRYPCEIEELSAFAPPVEEQPFDRFYKKPSPVKANANSSVISDTPKPAGEPAAPPSTSPMFTREPSTVPGKRIIYVTLPAGRQPIPVTAPAVNNRSSSPEAAPIEDKSSQLPQEETSVVEFLPRSKKHHSNRIVKPLVVGLSILALLAAGIFIGLSINKDTHNFQSKIAGHVSAADDGRQNHATAQQLPVPAVKSDPVPVNTDHGRDSVPNIVAQSQTVLTGPPISRPPRVPAPKEKPANSKTQALPPSPTKDSALGAAPVVHREAEHRADVEEKQESVDKDKDADIKANILSHVSVGANGYTVGTFGGITDLRVTVTNRSAYPLDLVVVEVQYIQANKKIYKTENLYFRGIGADSTLVQEAPKSSRGVKVQYKITTINSKELGLSYSGI